MKIIDLQTGLDEYRNVDGSLNNEGQKIFCERINKYLEEKKIPEKLNKLLYREDYATQNACIDDIIRQFNNLLDYLKSKGDE